MTALIAPQYESLTQEVDTLRIIFDRLPVGILLADAAGKLLFVNAEAQRVLDMGHADSAQPHHMVWGWYQADQVTLIPADRLPLARALRGETVSEELVFLRRQQPPRAVWLRVSAWPLKDGADGISGGVAMFQDFTHGREALHTLQLLSRVVTQIGDSVLITDTEGAIRYVNPAFETTTGYKQEEAIGKTPRILKSGLHDAEFYSQLWTRLKEGQITRGMVINRRKTGELYWSQQMIMPIRDEADRLTHFVSVSRDITDLKKKEEQEFQLQLARDVQRRFYAPPPSLPGFDIGAASQPVYETGGDYFDFIFRLDGSMVIAMGDVKGHGYGSALVMALTRAYLRSFASMQLEVHEILSRINRMLVEDLDHGHFVTLCLAHLRAGERRFSYANAGHVPGFALAATGAVCLSLDSTGPPLGLFSESQFLLPDPIELHPGEILTLITDGILEATTRGGEQFGSERLQDYVRAHSGETAAQIAKGICEDTRRYVENDPQDDDITALVIKV